MKVKFSKIKNTDVSTMDKTQLDEFNKEIHDFKDQTKFVRNSQLLKILYYIFGYGFGIGLGVCLAKLLLGYVYTKSAQVNLIVITCVLVVVCIAFEVLYRTLKNLGNNYSKCIDEKLMHIKNQYSLLQTKEELIKNAQTTKDNSTEESAKEDSTSEQA